MSTDPLTDARIIDAWHNNVSSWTRAVRGNEIESRTTVTNRAIIEAVLSRKPIHPGTGKPASVTFIAERSASAWTRGLMRANGKEATDRRENL